MFIIDLIFVEGLNKLKMKKIILTICVCIFGVLLNLVFAQSKKTLSPDKFEAFLKEFLSKTYSEKKFDSLFYVSSPIVMNFTDKKLGFGRFWNMGVYCNLYKSGSFGYSFHDSYFGEIQPNIVKLRVFANEEPTNGFCEEATSPDGIYYQTVEDFPQDWDMEKSKPIPTSAKLKKLNKKVVYIQTEKWIKKTLYFVQSGNKWFLIYIDDCDCSA
ncbi:hypothetical protein AD998_05355 [bacterium 336/3]|nr:hypothetical protein AD998_05355 [bacterium 336/3]